MAGRPRKQTVDYFPHYTSHKRTMDIIERRFGVYGYAFWFKLLEVLGSTDGHCFDIDDVDNWEYLMAKAYVDDDTGCAILDKLATLNAIDQGLYAEGKIWSQNFVDNLIPLYGKRIEDIPVKPTLCDIQERIKVPISDTGNSTDTSISTTGNSITDTGNKQRIGKDRKGNKKTLSAYSEHFECFWKMYPRKENKKKAFDIWKRKKLGNGLFDSVMDGLGKWKESDQWGRGVIPHATSWLNGHRWEDEIMITDKTGSIIDCKRCHYYNGGKCKNLNKPAFDPKRCSAFMSINAK